MLEIDTEVVFCSFMLIACTFFFGFPNLNKIVIIICVFFLIVLKLFTMFYYLLCFINLEWANNG